MFTALPLAAAANGAFYDDPTFWVAVAFFLTIALVGKKLVGTINGMLDDRAEGIKGQIEEATRLREEAQELLATFERKQHEAKKEAETIVERAKAEAQRIGKQAEADLEASLKRREKQAEDRIEQAKLKAMADVQNAAVEIAIEATRKVLAENLSTEQAGAMIDDAINNLSDKMH